MTDTIPSSTIDGSYTLPEREVSMLALASVLLRRRRAILTAILLGAVVGGVAGLLTTRTYTSVATFLSQASDGGGVSGIAAAASQFGIRVPTPSSGWTPALYAKIAQSRSVLGPIALDSFAVPELGKRRIATLDLLKIKDTIPERRLAAGVLRLSKMVDAEENKPLETVVLSVTTPWPSFSLALAQRVLAQVNAFNLQTRRSQATAEREFADQQVAEAERTLRDAENSVQVFMQDNRDTRAPRLVVEQDRLRRDVEQAQSLYTSLLQSREEARLREVRDTPVITVLEQPHLPINPNGRGSPLKALAGGLLAGLLAILVVFISEAIATARMTSSSEAREFFSLLDEAMPSRAHHRKKA